MYILKNQTMGACLQLCLQPMYPPTFNVHLPKNTPPVVKIVFATGDIEDLGPMPEEEEDLEEIEVDADDLVQISMPT